MFYHLNSIVIQTGLNFGSGLVLGISEPVLFWLLSVTVLEKKKFNFGFGEGLNPRTPSTSFRHFVS